ncbi:MAG: class I SAM-dependent methyltransferase [Pseudomonadota bacterium]
MKNEVVFWDKMAGRYFEKPISNIDAYEEKLRMTRELFTSDSTVLEFGCGTGGTALRHAPHVKRILATDISNGLLKIAREQAADQGVSNVAFEQANIVDFDASPESFDVVLGLSILHLLKDPAVVIERVRTWLKPGGYFVSSTACLGDKMGWFRYVGPIGRAIGKMPYVNVFSTDDCIRYLTDAGIRIETHWRPEGEHAVFIIAQKPALDA